MSFYLRPTRDSSIGIIAHIVTDRSTVIERKSYGIRIPKVHWDTKTCRVSTRLPEAKKINRMIEDALRDFESSTPKQREPEDTPVMEILNGLLNRKSENGSSGSTILRYRTITENFRKVLVDVFGTETLSVGRLRDPNIVDSILNGMRKNNKLHTQKREKTSTSLKNYLSFVAQAIEYWNGRSGVVLPINTDPFRPKFGRDLVKPPETHAEVCSSEDLMKIENYQPLSIKKGGELERLTKNLFLFQFYSGGLRWIDAALLTTLNIDGKKLIFNHQKTKNKQVKLLNYEMVLTLRDYHPEIFNAVHRNQRVGDQKMKLMDLSNVQHLVGQRAVLNMNLDELIQFSNLLRDMGYEKHPQFDSINNMINNMRDGIAVKFFKELSKLEPQFLFPVFRWDDFELEEISSHRFSEKSLGLIHRKRTNHNNCLSRICKILGTPRFTCHTPRHTFARYLQVDIGFSESDIQKCLGHKHLSTTHSYLQNRHPLTEHEQRLKEIQKQLGYR